jgi:hypothetical protein
MEQENQAVRERLTEFLDKHGLKLKYVAEVLGYSYKNFSNFKVGQRNFGMGRLSEINAFIDGYEEGDNDE